ncbi:hypothetical protein [Dongia deserti]|uniref:hypothetical protein n=1 Tax=Dongia deserti TaxID=2268030 RepID=UPI000E65BFC4|nr:hypothetical protein [Dongia deserti]
MIEDENLTEIAFSGGHVALLPKFNDARVLFQEAFARCDGERIPLGSATAAAMTEFLPRLTLAYGTQRAAFLLRRLADAIVAEGPPDPSWQ